MASEQGGGRWPYYAAGGLFMAAIAFWALSRPREDAPFRYDMSLPVKTEGQPLTGGELPPPYRGGPRPTAEAAAAAPTTQSARSEGPTDAAASAALPSDELAAQEESGLPGALTPPGSGGGAGGAPAAAAGGSSGKDFLSGVGASGKAGASAPGGRGKTMKAQAGGKTAFGRGASGPEKPAGYGEASGLSGVKKGLMDMSDDLFRVTDQQVKALGAEAARQIAKLRSAMAAEEKPLLDSMAAANAQPFQPPPAGTNIQRGQVWPVKGGGRVSQEFGPTNWSIYSGFTYQGRYYPHFHTGIDIAAPMGTPLLALDAGKVVRAGGTQSSGVGVTLQHPDGLSTTYHHMGLGGAGPTVRVGDYVSAGQVLGYIGMTGMTTGPHVHFIASKGGKPINPREVLPKK